MQQIRRALWHIEQNLRSSDLSMDETARAAGVSRFHLSRLFSTALGQTAISYARARRLSEAAKALAAGAPDILSVALDHGYGSHEAFTRAFRDQFGVTPEAMRAQRSLDSIKLTEPFTVTEQSLPDIDPPRFETRDAFTVAGLRVRYDTMGSSGTVEIPNQWRRFAPFIGHIPDAVGNLTYGVFYDFDSAEGGFAYIAGAEVSRTDDLPKEFESLRIPKQRYAVFTHRGHISTIPQTMQAIWQKGIVAANLKPADSASFERYDERFNPVTGDGEVEVWMALED
jgi:AraC family transcriptional regulator